MSFNNFKNGKQRCPICFGTKKYTIEDVKELIHNIDSDYICISKEYINNKTKLKIKHLKCNHIYETNLNNFLNKSNRCPKCQQSKGEMAVMKYLDSKNIKYFHKYRFDDCKGDYRTLEFDGEFHRKEGRFKSINCKEKLKTQQRYDKIKNDYCQEKNIKLIRINKIKDIEIILTEELKSLKV